MITLTKKFMPYGADYIEALFLPRDSTGWHRANLAITLSDFDLPPA